MRKRNDLICALFSANCRTTAVACLKNAKSDVVHHLETIDNRSFDETKRNCFYKRLGFEKVVVVTTASAVHASIDRGIETGSVRFLVSFPLCFHLEVFVYSKFSVHWLVLSGSAIGLETIFSTIENQL